MFSEISDRAEKAIRTNNYAELAVVTAGLMNPRLPAREVLADSVLHMGNHLAKDPQYLPLAIEAVRTAASYFWPYHEASEAAAAESWGRHVKTFAVIDHTKATLLAWHAEKLAHNNSSLYSRLRTQTEIILYELGERRAERNFSETWNLHRNADSYVSRVVALKESPAIDSIAEGMNGRSVEALTQKLAHLVT